MSAAEESSRITYQQLINEYGAALAVKDARAQELFDRATFAWEQLRKFPGPESELDNDAHLVNALQFAIKAEDAREANRLYLAMGSKLQSLINGDGQNKTLMAWLASGA